MHKDDLAELAGNPNFISGIYNYCDRWCERCPLATRCLLYATEQADPDNDDPEVRDLNNEKFWLKLHDIFRSTAEMISECAAAAGVDLDAVNVDDEMAEHERAMAEAEQHELAQTAQQYAVAVQDWFSEEFATEENLHHDLPSETDAQEMDLALSDAAEVIRWYQFFISVKLMRALSGSSGIDEAEFADEEIMSFDFAAPAEDEDDEDIDYDAISARSSLIDANGSAKIALVAIDRSIAAWRALQISLPEKSSTIKPMLIELDRLRRATEARFPRARNFIRPGFDETLSEFVS